jgi:DNA repair protein RadC
LEASGSQGKGFTIKNWSEDDRPREKLLAKGKETLSDAELVAILLGSGFKEQTAVDVAKTLLQNTGNDLDALGRLSVSQLSRTKGIGKVKAIMIVSALELGRRRKFTEKPKTNKVTCSRDAWEYMYPYMADLDHEQFYVLLLNRANIITEHQLISKGGVAGTVVDAKLIFRKIFEDARSLTSNIILCHNHPSGNLKPSQADIELTKKIKDAGKLLDITVLDHLIFANEGFYSFADEGLL